MVIALSLLLIPLKFTVGETAAADSGTAAASGTDVAGAVAAGPRGMRRTPRARRSVIAGWADSTVAGTGLIVPVLTL